MRVHLGGHLAWYDPQKRSWLELHPAGPVRLLDLAGQLGLPVGEIAIVAVNGRSTDLRNTLVADADKVEFYPPMGGG
jgi:molybdopterin converting factor small subunit